MKIFKELGWFFKEEKRAYFWGILALFVIAILNLLPPKIMGIIIDNIAKETLTAMALIQSIVALLVLAFVVYGLRYVWRICIFGASFRLEKKMRSTLFTHFTKMSPSFYQQYRVGDLMAHATNDLKAVQRVAGAGILHLADALITGISVILAMALTIHWKLTIVALIPMPLMIVGSQFLSKRVHSTFNVAQAAFSDMNNRTHEAVSGVKVTKTFGQEEAESHRFKMETEDVYIKNMAVTKYDAAFDPLIMIVIILSFIFVFLVGSLFIKNGEMTIGQLVTFINYIHLLVWPMLAFGFLYNMVERGSVSYDRIETILAIPPDIVEKENAITDIPNGDMRVDIKNFSYSEEDIPILQNIQFTLNRGETLGLVGKTGSGKTTLIKLLLRDYDTSGCIQYQNRDIKEYTLAAIHQMIGYVPQDQFLFSMSIEDNIRFGNVEATFAQVQEAARIACVHDDIMGFSNQYETMIGERGVSLSGGQKQRIAIARAILLNPEILILDDALSAVDAKTEETILQRLKDNREGKTTIIAAHRLSAIKHAQLILVFEEGQIIERGNHPSLLLSQGWYADIFQKQELYKEVKEHG